MIEAKCILASKSIVYPTTLYTLSVTMPRIILAQFNTHRVFSRNAGSSRAIPTKKILQRVMDAPFIPKVWGTAQKGMQPGEALPPAIQAECIYEWLLARDKAVEQAEKLMNLGVAKEHVNRLLEPFMWVTVLVTATDWSNFFKLRLDHMAQVEMCETAAAIKAAMATADVQQLCINQWHIPYITDEDVDLSLHNRLKVSTARCARVSYLNHEGQRDTAKDIALHDRLLSDGHYSPFEHSAKCVGVGRYANLTGFNSYRTHLERNVFPL